MGVKTLFPTKTKIVEIRNDRTMNEWSYIKPNCCSDKARYCVASQYLSIFICSSDFSVIYLMVFYLI